MTYWTLDLNYHDYNDVEDGDEGPFFHAAIGPFDTYEKAQTEGLRSMQFFAVVTFAQDEFAEEVTP